MQQAFLTVDLGFGDAGKGSIVDFLTRTYGAHTVVRYNGGAQAGHRVVAGLAGAPQRAHVFAQFGSGTLAGAATHLSRYMVLDPLAMLAEADHLRQIGVNDPFGRTTIDQGALVITPFQRAINRLREVARGQERHGSCGLGIGETVADALAYPGQVLYAGDFGCPDRLYAKLVFLHQRNLAKLAAIPGLDHADPQVASELAWLAESDWADWLLPAYAEFAAVAQIVPPAHLATLLQRPGAVIFEGAQGVLLDEWHGFHPYTTWSTTTLANADQLLAEADYGGVITRIGITRAYSTRHGAGPFVTEDAVWSHQLPDACNQTGTWQQNFRVGPLDLVMLRYAARVVGQLDALAVTCLDRMATAPAWQLCGAYREAEKRIAQLVPARGAHDLAYQAQLATRLFRCRPMLTNVADEAALLTAISHAAAAPIGIRSYGPTAAEKCHLDLLGN